jgi:hypothetical protein
VVKLTFLKLPYSDKLPVEHLASCFRHKTTPYKFYWLISLLQNIEQGKSTIPKIELFAGMIANAWYTVNYFKLSFGKQDKMQEAIERIIEIENLTIDEKQQVVVNKLVRSIRKETVSILKHFDANVPHWFLSPWFRNAKKNQIYEASRILSNGALYSLYDDRIEIHPLWIDYLQHFSGILKDYCYWNLSLYLQSRNPNVPDIPNKLIKPPTRGSLKEHRKEFWNIYFDEVKEIACIYTQKPLSQDNYAVEHFIPHSFVSHDLNWNLVPADPVFNSKKNNYLPKLDAYFEAFYSIQCDAINKVRHRKPNSRFLQEYIILLGSSERVNNIHSEEVKRIFKNTLDSLISIASFNGFQFLENDEYKPQ